MSLYKNFVGIDIGKFEFVISVYGKKVTKSYENTVEGIDKFIKEHKFMYKRSYYISSPHASAIAAGLSGNICPPSTTSICPVT